MLDRHSIFNFAALPPPGRVFADQAARSGWGNAAIMKGQNMATAVSPERLAILNGNGAEPHPVKATKGKKNPIVRVSIPAMNIKVFKVELEGISALICHNWDEKTRKMMLGKQMGEAQAAKEKKNPEACFKASLYPLPGGKGFGFPAVGFKSAAVDACSHVEGITKVEARGAFHVVEDLVPIQGTPTMRQDMVRVGMGSADIRFRGEFKTWKCTLTIRHNANVLTAEQIVNLLDTAGFAVGVGEWRPERNGSFGMFRVTKVLS